MYKLEDQEVGTEVIIEFKLQGKEFSFPSKIELINDSKVLLEPILLNGQILSFNNPAVIINIIVYQKNEKPLIWKHCKIQTIKDFTGKKHYYVYTPHEGQEHNRRNNYRIYVGNKGEVALGDNTSVQECFVKDISRTGIAIVTNKANIDANLINTPIRLSFFDYDLNYDFHLTGEVIRINEKDNKLTLGCKFTKEYNQIDKYLIKKQREELIRRSGNLTAQEIKKHRMQKSVRTLVR